MHGYNMAGVLGEFALTYWAQTHGNIAEEMYRAMATLKGFWIKLGQYISTRNDLALPVYVAKFKSFQDENGAAPFAEIKECVERELGCSMETVFASFETECLASASIAQVHAAVLRPEYAVPYSGRLSSPPPLGSLSSGWRKVAVKVQHKVRAEAV